MSRQRPEQSPPAIRWPALALAVLAACVCVSGASAGERQDVNPDVFPHIVNGLVTHDYPAVGALLRGDLLAPTEHLPITADNAALYCSGTLIGCRTFLTAAHCIDRSPFGPQGIDVLPDEAWVYLQHAGLFTVTSVAQHPDFAYPVADLAVLKLGVPVTGIEPAGLNASDPNPFIPAAGTIVGFGRAGGLDYLADLATLDLGIKRTGRVETTACLDFTPNPDSELVCFDPRNPIDPPGNDSGICHGDSGGPLFLDLGFGPLVAGVTSRVTMPSCLPPAHDYDANVYTYRDFILAELGEDETSTCGGLPPVGDPDVEVIGFDGRLDDVAPSATHTVGVGPGRNSVRFTLNAIETLAPTLGSFERLFDVDMYVKAGPGASPTDFDCKAEAASVFGACVFDLPAAATYSVFVRRVLGAGDYQVTATIFGGPPSECGDGALAFNEQCDDGNTADGDCCTAACQFEPLGSPCDGGGICDGAGACVPGPCSGDCDGSGDVTIAELITLVGIALGDGAMTSCPAGDLNGDGRMAVNEVVAGVGRSLDGCPTPEFCGGIAGVACPAGQRCELPAGMCGTADLKGACELLPGDCPAEVAPVCGCDGVAYTNDCARRKANAALAHDGVCASPLTAAIDGVVATAGVGPDTPGGAVMVIQSGRILHWAAYGLADVERRVPNTPHTIFKLASITKDFTALAIMMLAEAGSLAYDDPIATYLPELTYFGDAVTIRSVLHHTSGIPDFLGDPAALYVLLVSQYPVPSNADELALLVEYGQLLFTPGEQFRYSNTGYDMLGLPVERLSGTAYGDFLQEGVFGPLGMAATFSQPNPARLEDPDLARGYDPTSGGFVLSGNAALNNLYGSLGIYSTVGDLSLYDQALYGDRLVQPATLAEALTPGRLNDGTETRWPDDPNLSYGFGRFLGAHAGHQFVEDSGVTSGFRCTMAHFIDPQLTVIVLLNRHDISTPDLAHSIADLLLPAGAGSSSERTSPDSASRDASATAAPFDGTW